jgi:hypothetical protein
MFMNQFAVEKKMSQLRCSWKGLCFPTVRLRTRLQRCYSYAAFVQHGLKIAPAQKK